MKKNILLFSLLLIFAACEKDLGPKVKGVQITVGSDSITITNGTDSELRFFPVNQATLATLNWAPYCLKNGLIISAGDKETVTFDTIYGYESGCKLVVHWWACNEVDGNLEPGEIESKVVPTDS